MKLIAQWLSNLVIAFSIGTVISLIVVLGMLWWKGALADERVLGMLAALQGIKPAPPQQKAKAVDAHSEQPSLDEIMQARLRSSLDLDLRESAIDKSQGDLRTLEEQIKTESKRLDNWKTSFDQRVAALQTAATDAALLELQRTLEAMQPKQAKDQIMKMLADPVTPTDDPMQDVVTMLKSMPLDKQKNLIREFKTDKEIEMLAEILRRVRLGSPDSELLRETRNELQQKNP